MSNTTPIKDQRLKRGWTLRDLQHELADDGIKVSESQLSKIERRVCMPYPPLRAALAKILNLDIDLQTVQEDEKVEVDA
ncbi:helix-turn-helix transcriptional regulator [Nonomuraea pusilla]|uniref:helix-turn-helix domain-containing protein n=1 Tax=Nonomuraea pusilla TaxID=46177 RepID=UPI003326AAE3